MNRLIFIVLFFAMILVACGDPKSHGVNTMKMSAATDVAGIYLVLLCDNESKRNLFKKNIYSRNSDLTMGKSDLCVDFRHAYQLSENFLQIKPVTMENISIIMKCVDEKSFEEQVGNLPLSGDLVLISSGVAVVSYKYLHRNELRNRCGKFISNDLEQAIDICEDVRVLAGLDATGCTSYCEASDPSSLKDVCIVGNNAH